MSDGVTQTDDSRRSTTLRRRSSPRRWRRRCTGVLIAGVALLAGAAPAAQASTATPAAAARANTAARVDTAVPGPYAPLDRPGPPLDVPAAALAASLSCSPGVTGAARAPVLLVHGTLFNAQLNWSWTYEPALAAAGIPYLHREPARLRHGRHRHRRRVRRPRHPPHARAGRAQDRHPGLQPGRDGAAVGPAVLARHPRHGRPVRGHRPVEPRHPRRHTRCACSAAPPPSGSSRPGRASWPRSTAGRRRSPASPTR